MRGEKPHGLALCAGIGGLEAGVDRAIRGGVRTVAYVEREAFPVAHLVSQMESGALAQAPIWDDLTTFNARPWRGRVSILTGGYPCQPFSSAGRRKGLEDERWLWDDIRRIIGELRPVTCFFENTPNHSKHGLEVVVRDLEGMGYSVACGLFRASDVGLPHKRERLFILAHANGFPLWQLSRRSRWTRRACEALAGYDRGDVAHGDDPRCGCLWGSGVLHGERTAHRCDVDGCCSEIPHRDVRPEDWPEDLPEPGVRGTADGLQARTHRLRALGNAVVPAVAEHAFHVLTEALSELAA